MNGAETLVKTLLAHGVDTVFANPGTSEMHFVGALDAHPAMRCVLCLFEGGASGAADGYFRMKQDVAATLLHLGPGLGNALANLHNARKAGSGVVNVVGDHATRHQAYESPLKGDLAGISRAVSHWTRIAADAGSVAGDGAAAIRAARAGNGRIATLVLPADTAWDAVAGADLPPRLPPPAPERPSEAAIIAAAARLRAPGAALMVGGPALHGPLRDLAGRIAAATGCRLVADALVGRIALGAGTARIDQLVYPLAPKIAQMADLRSMTLVGTDRPVAFFAYPGQPSLPEPSGCTVTALCRADMDIGWTLSALADAVGVTPATQPARVPLDRPALPDGALTLAAAGRAIAALMPERTIVSDEALTSGRELMPHLAMAAPHDLMGVAGGAIGFSLPAAVGAAIACPDRKVLALTGDGSAMYTLQSLWTMAREGLDVTVVIFANRGYQILRDEMVNVGVAGGGRNAAAMMDVDGPLLDWVALARGHGIPACRPDDATGFAAALRAGFEGIGPSLIELRC
ncbi:acetolactate synthase large subunit [Meridianimarinicoccus sp. RP-17]